MNLILTSDTHYGMDGKTHAKHDKFWRKVQADVVKHNVEALIWAGDLACNKQRQLRRSIEQCREHIKIPILFVRGNHDWWDAPDGPVGYRNFSQLQREHEELLRKHDIVHLEGNPVVLDNVLICGWDGWYGNSDPDTNDAKYMFNDVEGCPMHTFMSNRAWKKFEDVMDLDIKPYRAAIAVTHFNPFVTDRKYEKMCANLKFYEMIKDKFDIFCCGHNHQQKDLVEDGCRVLNSGSDYNKPQYLLFEV